MLARVRIVSFANKRFVQTQEVINMDLSNHSPEGGNPSVGKSRDAGDVTSISILSENEHCVVEDVADKKKGSGPKASTGGSAGSKGLFVALEPPLSDL